MEIIKNVCTGIVVGAAATGLVTAAVCKWGPRHKTQKTSRLVQGFSISAESGNKKIILYDDDFIAYEASPNLAENEFLKLILAGSDSAQMDFEYIDVINTNNTFLFKLTKRMSCIMDIYPVITKIQEAATSETDQ